MEVFRFAQNVWGQEMLLGMSWDLLWVPVAAALACIAVHQFLRLASRRN